MLYRDYDRKDDDKEFRQVQDTLSRAGLGIDVKKFIESSLIAGKGLNGTLAGLAAVMVTRSVKVSEDTIDRIILYTEHLNSSLTGRQLYTGSLMNYYEAAFDLKIWERVEKENFPVYIDTVYGCTTRTAGLQDEDGSKYPDDTACEIRIRSTGQYVTMTFDLYRTDTRKFTHCSILVLDTEHPDDIYISFTEESKNNRALINKEGAALPVRKRKVAKFFSGYYPEAELYYLRDVLLCAQGVLRTYYNTIDNRVSKTRNASKRNSPDTDKAKSISVVGRDRTLTSLSSLGVRYIGSAGEYKGGHHASPVPHGVSGHWRHYKNKTVWIEGYYKPSKKYAGDPISRVIDVDR